MSSQSVSNTSTASALFDYFAETLQCPVELELLTQAVALVPCNHKVNQATAEKLYGKMLDNRCELKNKPCVVCRTVVERYDIDSMIRDLATKLLGHPNSKEESAKHVVQPVVQPMAVLKVKPYPGKPADFVEDATTWNTSPCFTGMRTLRFESESYGSLLAFITFQSKYSGSIEMSVTVNLSKKTNGRQDKILKGEPAFEEYMQSLGVTDMKLRGYPSCPQYVFDNADDIKKAFAGIAQNNDFPPKYRLFLEKLVERGSF